MFLSIQGQYKLMQKFIHGDLELYFRETPWDSRVLGVKTNEILGVNHSESKEVYDLFSEFEKHCVAEGFLFTSYRIKGNESQLKSIASDLGYRFVEASFDVFAPTVKIQLEKIRDMNFSLRASNQSDKAELIRLAGTIFNHGRFHEDPYVDSIIANKRNELWMADMVLDPSVNIQVGERNNRIFGFMASKVSNGVCNFLLGGVSQSDLHLAYSLWKKVIELQASEKNCREFVATVSASNLPVLNLFQALNFTFKSSYFGFHKHRRTNL